MGPDDDAARQVRRSSSGRPASAVRQRILTWPAHVPNVPTIIGFSGSLRRASFNAMLLRAAAELAPPGTTIAIESIRDIPLYDADVETSAGVPAPVQALKDKIAGADGLLIVTPEYNNSVPGVAKNAIDWLSRPPSDIPRVFGGKPVVVMGATSGPNGTLLAQPAWLPVSRSRATASCTGALRHMPRAARLIKKKSRTLDKPTSTT